MKHNVTPLDGENEPFAFSDFMFSNYFLENTLEYYLTRPTPTSSDKQFGLLPHPTDDNETCTACFSVSSSSSNNGSSSNTSTLNGPCTDKLWTMSLDKSGMHDDSRTECISIIQNKEICMISSYLKFGVTNNDVEALMLNTWRTNTMNEQINLGIHHDPNMANLGTSFTLQ